MSPDLIKELGLPVALIVAAAYFFIKHFWPFMLKSVEEERKNTREAHSMVSGLRETLIQHTEISRQIVSTLKEMKEGMDARNRHS